MNTFKSLLTIALLTTAVVASATIHRVNNISGIDADFNNLSTAISSATAGDTLYVGGSSTAYGTINVSKELVIIGPGNFLDVNDSTQAYQQTAEMNGTFTISSGGAGSVISGLYFTGEVNIDADNIVIQNCRSDYGSSGNNFQIYSNHSNILMSRNFIHNTYTSSSSSYRCISLDGNNNNILISNNIILRGNTSTNPGYGYSIYSPSNSSAVFQNNTVMGFWQCYNSVVSGNLMYSGNFSGSGNTVTGNWGNSTQFGTANGNRENVNVSSLVGVNGTYDEDQFWVTSKDTINVPGGATVTRTDQIYVPSSSNGTFTETVSMPDSIISATVTTRGQGSINYAYARVEGTQVGYNSGNYCYAYNTWSMGSNYNATSLVQGKNSVAIQFEYSWNCGYYNHYLWFDWTFTVGPYSIPPTTVGAFYGQNPYRLSSLPPIPSIFRANVPSSGVTSEPFIYDFSSRSNK